MTTDDRSKSKGEVQGEGDYKAGRRYNEATRQFVEENDVSEAARDAEPESKEEQQNMEHAEQRGRQRAKDEDPLLDRPEDIDKTRDR